jgi:predicted ABC-type ATPase
MPKNKGKKIIIIAGLNCADKTTFAREFLPNEANCPIFINADLIAALCARGYRDKNRARHAE